MSADLEREATRLFIAARTYDKLQRRSPNAPELIALARRVAVLSRTPHTSDAEAIAACESLVALYRETGLMDWADSLFTAVH